MSLFFKRWKIWWLHHNHCAWSYNTISALSPYFQCSFENVPNGRLKSKLVGLSLRIKVCVWKNLTFWLRRLKKFYFKTIFFSWYFSLNRLVAKVGEIWKSFGFDFNYKYLIITDWVGTAYFLVKFIKNMQVWKATILTECCELLKSSEWLCRSRVSNATMELRSAEQILHFISMFTFPLYWELHFPNQTLQAALSRHWSSCKQMEEGIIRLSKPAHI